MDQRLRDFEVRRIAARSSPPDLHQAVSGAYMRLGLVPSPHFMAANERIIGKISEEEALIKFEYHNQHHVQDVIDAASVLLSVTSDCHITPQEREALLTAALGHDLHHDGRGTLPEPELEHRAARSVTEIGRDSGIPENLRMLIEALIVATHPPQQMTLRAGRKIDTSKDKTARLKLILGEADVLASWTPELGSELSRRLAQEWASTGVETSLSPTSREGRKQFLAAYRMLSAEAVSLGVDVMIAKQLKLDADDGS